MDGRREGPVSLEILCVGPLFREVDYRWLEAYMKKPPFQKHTPLLQVNIG